MYIYPQIAEVDYPEDVAKSRGILLKTCKFRMSANWHALISREESRFVRDVADTETGIVLGAQLTCARASDLFGEVKTAVVNHLTAEQLVQVVRAHLS